MRRRVINGERGLMVTVPHVLSESCRRCGRLHLREHRNVCFASALPYGPYRVFEVGQLGHETVGVGAGNIPSVIRSRSGQAADTAVQVIVRITMRRDIQRRVSMKICHSDMIALIEIQHRGRQAESGIAVVPHGHMQLPWGMLHRRHWGQLHGVGGSSVILLSLLRFIRRRRPP